MYAITNNHHLGKAVVNALEMSALVTGEPVKMAPKWKEHYPELKELDAPESEPR